jgi:aspartyl-tRNA(Asn)/glutamyl-tRNA(Gln) amidotransferase subunit A
VSPATGAAAIASAVQSGSTQAEDTAREAMACVVNGESGPARLNAFVSFDYEAAISQAQRVDADIAHGAQLPLAGVAVGVKDNICTLGLPTTCASRSLAGYRSPFEATVVRRLRAAGAIIAGKTNLDEFAMGSSTEHSAFGPTVNPRDRERVAGGSSGGSAAAVAAGMVPAALGSDTGGSVRQPAAFCGVVGLKPTWGAISRYGLIAFASSLDQVGVLARSVADAALVFAVIRGRDVRDATSRDLAADSAYGARTLTIGVPREYLDEQLDPAVRSACERAVHALRENGVHVREVSLPHTRYAVAAYAVIASAEASTNLARFDGVRYGRVADGTVAGYDAVRAAGFGAEVRRRIALGTFVLSADRREQYYALAQRTRAQVANDFARVLADGVDLLFTPTTPTPAFHAGTRLDDPYAMYSSDVFTVPASLAGLPAMSLPIGRAGRLPIGGQLIGPPGADDRLLSFGRRLEEWLS